ncbi:MAG: LPS export ABC transporter periplasmic protein LptC [Alphaproteobacteria bacterium]|nr:LPS export ABC transporter periplasmic protein LptC [Alphaproteobacteria bacterium SS10]
MTDLRDPTTKERGKGAERQPTLDLAGGAVGLSGFEAGSEYYAGRPSYLGPNPATSAVPEALAEDVSSQELFEAEAIHIAAAEPEMVEPPVAEAVFEPSPPAQPDPPPAPEPEPEPLLEAAAPVVDEVVEQAPPEALRPATLQTTPRADAKPLSIQAAPGAKGSDWYRQRAADRVNPRRSVVIRMLRVAVPSLAAVLLIGTLVWPLINADQNGLRQLGRGESAMLNARFEGYDDADRLVSITADQVTRSTGDTNLIDLEQPLADITYDDGSRVAIRANQGRFDEERQQLLLQGDVNMFQPNGFEFTTSRLQVDTSQRAAWSDQPVTGTGPGGSIAGSAVQILENGRFLVFPGPGRLTLDQVATNGGG